ILDRVGHSRHIARRRERRWVVDGRHREIRACYLHCRGRREAVVALVALTDGIEVVCTRDNVIRAWDGRGRDCQRYAAVGRLSGGEARYRATTDGAAGRLLLIGRKIVLSGRRCGGDRALVLG